MKEPRRDAAKTAGDVAILLLTKGKSPAKVVGKLRTETLKDFWSSTEVKLRSEHTLDTIALKCASVRATDVLSEDLEKLLTPLGKKMRSRPGGLVW
jgi:hypothetical protein